MNLIYIFMLSTGLLFSQISLTYAGNSELKIGVYLGFTTSLPGMQKKMSDALNIEGIKVKFTHELPAQRSLILASQGILDGDILRQSYATEDLPSLLQVSVPLQRFEYWVWIESSNECPRASGDLPNLKPVGILGLKYFDFAYKQSNVGFEQVTSLKALADMMRLKRADYSIAGISAARQLSKLTGIQLKQCFKRPLISTYGFLYVNEKHRKLIPKLEKALSPLRID